MGLCFSLPSGFKAVFLAVVCSFNFEVVLVAAYCKCQLLTAASITRFSYLLQVRWAGYGRIEQEVMNRWQKT